MPSKINTAVHQAQLVAEFDVKGMVAQLQLDETVVPVAVIADLREPQVRGGVFEGRNRVNGVAGERPIIGFTNATTSHRTHPSPALRILYAQIRSDTAGELAVLLSSTSAALSAGSTQSHGFAIDPVRFTSGTVLAQSGSVITAGTRAAAHPGVGIVRNRQLVANVTTELPELVGIELQATRFGIATPGLIVQLGTNNAQLDLTLRWEEFPPGD